MLTEEIMQQIIADNLRGYYGFGPEPSEIKIHEATINGTWALFSVGRGYKYEFTAALFPLELAKMIGSNYYESAGMAISATGGQIKQLAPTWATEEYNRPMRWCAMTPDQARTEYKKELERIYQRRKNEQSAEPRTNE